MRTQIKNSKRKEEDELIKARTYSVVKHNDLIQKSRHQLTLQEQKIVLYLISKLKPSDKDFENQVFSISEFCNVCGLDSDNGGNYSYIKNTLKSLRDRSIWITLEDGSETTLSWINKVTLNKRSGTVLLRLDNDMKPYLLQLQGNFTKYELLYTLAMRSQYSVRLYELLKSYQYKKHVIFDIDEFKRLIYAEQYERYPDFKRKVIDIALREINGLTDISVTYSPIKIGKRFAEVSFEISPKKALERWGAGQTTIKALDKTN